MTLGKLLCERLTIRIHTSCELLLCNIYVINLDVEILTSGERVAFFLDLVVGYSNGEIVYSLALSKCRDYLLYLGIAQTLLLIAALLILFAQLAGIDKYDFVCRG